MKRIKDNNSDILSLILIFSINNPASAEHLMKQMNSLDHLIANLEKSSENFMLNLNILG